MELQVRNIRHAVDAARAAQDLGCSVFLGAGSQAEYGCCDRRISPQTPANPENGYGMAKLCAGQMSRALCAQLGMRLIWCRIFSVYGPCDGEGTLISSGIRQLLAGERLRCTKGEQLWDYLHCDDAAAAFHLVAERGRDGAVYCVGSGQARPLREYIEILRDAVNPQAEIGFGDIPYSDKQVMYLCADIESLHRDTGFAPAIPFEEGIRNTVEWYRSTHESAGA